MFGDLDQEQIESILKHNAVGRLGCHADGKTYIVPVGYAYDGEAIYAYSADGMKIAMMRKNPEVCFEVDHYASLTNWKSVVCWGRFEELRGKDAERAIDLLTRRFADLTIQDEHLLTPGQRLVAASAGTGSPKDPILYRIRVSEKTGRYELR